MSLSVLVSSSLKTLAGELAGDLDRARKDPFASPLILVPSLPIQRWLTYELATARGIAANLDFQFFEKGLWEILRALDSRVARPVPVTRLNREPVQWMIVAVLLTAERDGELAPLLNYTGPLSDLSDRFAVRKLWQLAERLSRLFREYEAADPRMIAEWLEERSVVPRSASAMWRCQRALYRQIFAPKGIRDRVAALNGVLPQTTLEYARDVLSGTPQWRALTPRGTLYVFGLPSAGSALLSVLEQLSEHLPVRMYQWRLEPDSESMAGALAARWNAGSVQKSIWLSDKNVQRVDDTSVAGTSRLAAFQAAAKGSARAIPGDSADRSIELLACPGIRREVEAVRDAIVHAMETTPDLKLTDIGVLVPDMTAYRPHLEAVFQRDDIHVPFNLSDTTAEDDSVYAQAVAALLALAGGRFTRKDVFALALNPCFLAAQKVSHDDVMQWLDWADRLNVFREFDAGERIEARPFTWRHALRRLRLGRVMAGQSERLGVYEGVVPFEGSEPEAVARFSAVIERLARFAERCGDLSRSAEAWADLLKGAFEEFLCVPEDRLEEENVRRELFKALDAFRSADHILACAAEGKKNKSARLRLAFPVLRELVAGSIAEVPSRYGHLLLDGVTLCALRAERPIPFRITFVLGLGEGLFPGQDVPSGLDVRDQSDVSRRLPTLGESGRLAFLESIVSTRERIVFSYVSRNLQKDETSHPCALIRELESVLAPDAGLPGMEIPISASSERYLLAQKLESGLEPVPVAYRRQDILRALAALEGQLDGRSEISDEAKKSLRALLPHLQRARANTRLELLPLPAEKPEGLSVTLRNLAEYLKDPLKEKLRRHLGIYDEDADDERALEEDEPFFSDDRARGGLFKNALQSALSTRGEVALPVAAERALKENHAERQWTGDAPAGPFARLDRSKLQAQISEVLAKPAVIGHLEKMKTASAVVVGRRSASTEMEAIFPPLEFELPERGVVARVSGQIAHTYRSQELGPREFLAITSSKRSGKSKGTDPHLVEAWLMYVCLCASTEANARGLPGRRWLGEAGCRLWLLHGEGLKGWAFPMLRADDARAYLAALVADYFNAELFEHLPLEPVVKALSAEEVEAGKIRDGEEFRERLVDSLDASGENDYGYNEPELFRLLPDFIPANAAELAMRRVLPFLKAGEIRLEGGEA